MKKQITVKSANNKYKAILKNDVVTIFRVSDNPVEYRFSLQEVLKHDCERSHFVLSAVTDTGMWMMCNDMINADSFLKIQNHFK